MNKQRWTTIITPNNKERKVFNYETEEIKGIVYYAKQKDGFNYHTGMIDARIKRDMSRVVETIHISKYYNNYDE